MANVLFGGGIIEMRGSVSGNTFSRSRFGASMRARTSPIKPTSNSKNVQQALLVLYSRSWSQNLTEAQRADWNTFALTNPSTNVFGQVSYLSGQQWYVKLSVNAKMVGGTASASPPISGSYPGLDSLSLSLTAGSPGSIVISWTNSSIPDTPYLNIFASPCLSQGISYVSSRLRRIGSASLSGSSLDITSLWLAKFPGQRVKAGMKIFVMVNLINQLAGQSSPGIIAADIA